MSWPGPTPDQRPDRRVVGPPLLVGPPPERHDVVPPLLDQAADDALNPIADEVPAHLVGLLLGGHQLQGVRVEGLDTHRIGLPFGRVGRM